MSWRDEASKRCELAELLSAESIKHDSYYGIMTTQTRAVYPEMGKDLIRALDEIAKLRKALEFYAEAGLPEVIRDSDYLDPLGYTVRKSGALARTVLKETE